MVSPPSPCPHPLPPYRLYFRALRVRLPTPVPFGAALAFFSFLGALGLGVPLPSSFLGRPRPFLLGSTSPVLLLSLAAAAAFLSAFLSAFFSAMVFFLVAVVAAPLPVVVPSAFLGRPRPSLAFLAGSSSRSSSAGRFSPALGPSSASSSLPFCSTVSSFWFLTTSLPGRDRATAGLSGSALRLMVLPRFDWTETSPSVFFSDTSPEGWLLPCCHVTGRRDATCQ